MHASLAISSQSCFVILYVGAVTHKTKAVCGMLNFFNFYHKVATQNRLFKQVRDLHLI